MDENDIAYLKKLDSSEPQVLFGSNVLLKNLADADRYFSLIPEQEQEIYKEYPIWNLYCELKKS